MGIVDAGDGSILSTLSAKQTSKSALWVIDDSFGNNIPAHHQHHHQSHHSDDL